MWEDVWGAITALSLTRRGKIILACGVMLIWFLARQQLSQMDDIFFRPSVSGAKGLSLYLMGDYSGAAKAYRAHLQQEHRTGRTSGDPTLDAILRGDLKKAKDFSQKTLEQAPDNVTALLDAGEIALEENDLPAAVDIFDRILQEHPDHAEASVLASVAYARSGDDDNAIASLNRMLRHSRIGSRPSAFFKLLETTGDKARLPDGKKPLCLLANYYRYLRIFDPRNGQSAITYAEKAIDAGDRPAEAYFAIGIVYEKQHKSEWALQAFLKAIEVDPQHAEAYRWASVIYSRRGDIPNQYRMIKAAFEAAPADPFYLNSIDHVLTEELGDLYQARDVYRKVLERTPDNVRALDRLGYLYGHLGDYELSLEYYQKALLLEPRNPAILEGIGFDFDQLGKTEEAIAAFRQAQSLAPYRAEPHTRLATLYHDQRRYREAIEEYEQAFKLGERDMNRIASLCVLYHLVSEFPNAVDCFRKVLKRDPRNILANRMLPEALNNLRLQK